MRKKDPDFNENSDRSFDSTKLSPAEDESSENVNTDVGASQFTKVKNASASGLGTMGRSDEKLSDQSGNSNDDAY